MKKQAPRPLVTSSPDLLWPALASPAAAELLALLYQLEQSEWWPAGALEQAQRVQLARLLEHARERSPLYRARLAESAVDPRALRPGDLQRLPLLSRRELLMRSSELDCGPLDPAHGPASVVHTSGSTGEIVTLKRSGVTQSYLSALGLRVHDWHQTDFRQTLAAVRADSTRLDDDARAAQLGWGSPVTLVYRTGPAYTLPIATDIAEQAEWLLQKRPGYLMTYPTNLTALLDHFEERGLTLPSLRGVRSLGETLHPETRRRCREQWNSPVVDVYSAQEVGIIAVECPESGLYHVQSESLIVEVLDDEGRTCEPGQAGRVVVTDLHNFAMPVIRYAIGDRALVGPACSCGRALPTLMRILGRERHLLVLPDGRRHWPLVGTREYRKVAPILEYQLVQESLESIEVRLVTESPLSAAQEQALSELVQRSLGHPFQLRFHYFDGALPRPAGGKFEEFVSLLTQ